MVVIRRCWYHDDGMILIFLAYHVHVFVSNLKPQMLFIFTSCVMKFYWYLDHHPWIEMCRTATHFVVQYSSSVFPLLCGCFNLQYIPQDKHVFYRYFSMTWLTWLSFFRDSYNNDTMIYYITCNVCMIYVYSIYVWYMYTMVCMIYVSMIYYITMIYIQYFFICRLFFRRRHEGSKPAFALSGRFSRTWPGNSIKWYTQILKGTSIGRVDDVWWC
jgi:hypothetical protein